MKIAGHRTVDEYSLAFEQGDEEALAFFFHEFHPALALYASRWVQNRSIAEEIASMAFVKTWKMHYKLTSYEAIRAYLYKIVRNDSLTEVKKQGRRNEVHHLYQSNLEDPRTAFDDLVRIEVYSQLHHAMKELSPGNRKVITMHFMEGKTTGEIAKELKVSDSTVKTLKYRGLKALRKRLEGGFMVVVWVLGNLV